MNRRRNRIKKKINRRRIRNQKKNLIKQMTNLNLKIKTRKNKRQKNLRKLKVRRNSPNQYPARSKLPRVIKSRIKVPNRMTSSTLLKM